VTETQLTAERIAQNQATFRDANERIEEAAREYNVNGGLPFICECSDPSCVEILRLKIAEYESVRARPTYFISAPGHYRAAAGWAAIVEQRDGYDVVEKIGRAAGIAEALDPRSE
jgi:hypothetical protein